MEAERINNDSIIYVMHCFLAVSSLQGFTVRQENNKLPSFLNMNRWGGRSKENLLLERELKGSWRKTSSAHPWHVLGGIRTY